MWTTHEKSHTEEHCGQALGPCRSLQPTARKTQGCQFYNHKETKSTTTWESMESEPSPVKPLRRIQSGWYLDGSFVKPLSVGSCYTEVGNIHKILHTYNTILHSIITLISHQFNSLVEQNLGYALFRKRNPLWALNSEKLDFSTV